jgi:hypothetical protein
VLLLRARGPPVATAAIAGALLAHAGARLVRVAALATVHVSRRPVTGLARAVHAAARAGGVALLRGVARRVARPAPARAAGVARGGPAGVAGPGAGVARGVAPAVRAAIRRQRRRRSRLRLLVRLPLTLLLALHEEDCANDERSKQDDADDGADDAGDEAAVGFVCTRLRPLGCEALKSPSDDASARVDSRLIVGSRVRAAKRDARPDKARCVVQACSHTASLRIAVAAHGL